MAMQYASGRCQALLHIHATERQPAYIDNACLMPISCPPAHDLNVSSCCLGCAMYALKYENGPRFLMRLWASL